MGETEMEVQVRTLSGESTTVSVPHRKTIGDLKRIFAQTFHPASSSPNFHLFLKGEKLNVQSEISSCSIGSEDFLVLVPFNKKTKQSNENLEESSRTVKETNGNLASSELSESAWSDLMEDLSSLRDACGNEDQTCVDLEMNICNDDEKRTSARGSSSRMKQKRGQMKTEGNSDKLVLNILQSAVSGDTVLDDQNCEILICILESVNCLSDLDTGNCILKETTLQDFETGPCTSKSAPCLCPSWLRHLVKSFSFLNIYSAYLHVQQKEVTLDVLEGLLDKLVKFGFQAGISDVKHLSNLCPKVVHIVDKETDIGKMRDTLVIKTSADLRVSKRVSPSRIFSAMKNREISFRTKFSMILRAVKCKIGKEVSDFLSLEDLLAFVKGCDAALTESQSKRSKRTSSAGSSCHSFEIFCHDTKPLLPLEMLEHLRAGIGSRGQVVHIEEIQARNASYVDIPAELSEKTRSALRRIGITRLYSHQAEAVQASLDGKNVVVATMTSSGKSLCYNLPVVEALSHDLSACALYLFPTKALAQDQLRAFSVMTEGLDDDLKVGVYDGDTVRADRLWLRDNARVLITNPDMLHISILPFHVQFRRIFSNLRFVIIDEAHAYKGAFGCHTALILRRLRRLCFHAYGCDPSFIFSTATSANPSEHAMELANLPNVQLIQNDGSPSAPKTFALWNPPLCLRTVWKRTKTRTAPHNSIEKNVVAGRASPIMEVSYLFAEMVQHGLRCIAFCRTRKLCELVLCYTREILQEAAPHMIDSICAYRAGYVAEDRRRIESELFSGNICGIAATNALELGIDVGHIDVTLHLGFPGSIASLWQQAGRSGRREKPSLAVYVAFDGPLDQYFMKFPEKLFRGSIECCHVDAKNEQVLQQHLACAALEYPLSLLYDKKYFGPGIENAIMTLKTKGYLSTDLSRSSAARVWNYIGHEKTPSSAISIRAIETERYKVIDMQNNEVLEEIEESKAFFQVYEGAVYMNQGKTYLVKNLDLSSKMALCQKADLKYYTKTRDYTDIHVIGGQIAYPPRITDTQCSRTTAQAHVCKVTTTWFGFRRIWKGSNQVIDTVELSLPDYSYESQAVWVRVPQSVKEAVETTSFSFRGGLHAAGHALLNVVPL